MNTNVYDELADRAEAGLLKPNSDPVRGTRPPVQG